VARAGEDLVQAMAGFDFVVDDEDAHGRRVVERGCEQAHSSTVLATGLIAGSTRASREIKTVQSPSVRASARVRGR